MRIPLIRLGLISFGYILTSFVMGVSLNSAYAADTTTVKPSMIDYTIGMATAFGGNTDESAPAIIGSVGLAGKSGTDTARAAISISEDDLELSSDMKMRRVFAMMGSVVVSGEGRLHVGAEHNDARPLDGLGYLEGQASLGNLLGYGRLSIIGDAYHSNELMNDFRQVSNVGLLSEAYLNEHSGYSTLGLGGRYRLSDRFTLLGITDFDWNRDAKLRPKLGVGLKLSDTLPGILTTQVSAVIKSSPSFELATEYIQDLSDTARLTAQTTAVFDNKGAHIPTYSLSIGNTAEDWDFQGKLTGGEGDFWARLTTLGAEFGIRAPGEVRFFIEYEFNDKMTTIGGRTRF